MIERNKVLQPDVSPLVDTGRYALTHLLGVEPTGRKEDLPASIVLPREVLTTVDKFITVKPYGEMTGIFKYDLWHNRLALKEEIEGEDADSNKNFLARHQTLSKLNSLLERVGFRSIFLSPSVTLSRKRNLLFVHAFKELISAPSDVELHTHPDRLNRGMKFRDLNIYHKDIGINRDELDDIKEIDIPASYWMAWSSFPSVLDLYIYVYESKRPPIAAVVSAASRAGTILVPLGRKFPSSNLFGFDFDIRNVFRVNQAWRKETQEIRQRWIAVTREAKEDPQQLEKFFTGEFKSEMRKAITRIGDTFGFVPYFADDYKENFMRV